MKKLLILNISAFLFLFLLLSCTGLPDHGKASGKLFIIGGGNRTDSMMNELIDLAGIRSEGYAYILPMASSVPDSSIMWTKEDFNVTGVKRISGFNFLPGVPPPEDKLDSLRNAKLIFISGGDQSRFMAVIKDTPLKEALYQAYKSGSVIAGTSAGAAVMSKRMITGNQIKHPDTETGFITIESDNVEIKEGLGLLTDVIIDQHFIKRQRLNRLVAASIENHGQLCIGIDESTAIIVDGDYATVTGISQVVVIKNTGKVKNIKGGLLGTDGLQLSVYLPGQKFKLR
jgi:cyanophycinase